MANNAQIIQRIQEPSGKSGALGTVWNYFLPAPTLAGNAIVVYVGWAIEAVTAGAFTVGQQYTIVSIGSTNFTAIGASSNTVGLQFTATGVGSGTGTATAAITSVSDDQGNTYSVGVATILDISNTYQGAAFYLLDNPGNVRRISVNFASTGADFVQIGAAEVYGIAASAALDGSHGQASSGTTWNAGSFSTTTNDDVVIYWARNTLTSSLNPQTCTKDATLVNGRLLMFDNVETGMAMGFGTLGTAGSINPGVTSDQNVPFIGLAMAFKTATHGTLPPAIGAVGALPRIVAKFGFDCTPGGNTERIVIPTSSQSNFLAYSWVAGAATNPIITSVTDSKFNRHELTPSPPGSTTSAGYPNHGYVKHPILADDLTLNVTIAQAGPHGTLVVYEVENMYSDFDVFLYQLVGNVTGNTTLPTVVTDMLREGSLQFAGVGVEGGTCKQCLTAGYYSDNCYFAEEDATLNQLYENNGFGHRINTVPEVASWGWFVTSDTFHWSSSVIVFSPRRFNFDYSLSPKPPIALRAQGLQ